MIKKTIYPIGFALLTLIGACSAPGSRPARPGDTTEDDIKFSNFESGFLDAYWKQYPSSSILVGYGKYYDSLVIPDSASVRNNIHFSRFWIDSLNSLDYHALGDNKKISFNIIKNQLESDQWYQSEFKLQEWDASIYNISAGCDYIINQPYAPLDERLRILSRHLQHADTYYRAALGMLHEPTKEHIALAILQNQGGLSIFGQALTDSIRASHLSDSDKNTLRENTAKTIRAINDYVGSLQAILAGNKMRFRDFRIGKDLFAAKFKYDMATDFTPEELYGRALSDLHLCHREMFEIAVGLWSKYYAGQAEPKDSFLLVQSVLEKIQDQHAKPKDFFDSLSNQLARLKKFILEKNLFDFDTANPPVRIRIMPAFERGVTIASAEFAPPYQKQGNTYFNVDDLSLYPPEKAASSLREYNNYLSQLLSIHEGVPGHCLQGIYNKKKSPDVIRSVFQNGAMVEGWAVYSEGMMLENGWGDHAPEMELAYDKWKLRELANVIVDYDMQVLKKPQDSIMVMLVHDCFQTSGQATEKYHRATVSQVQLCSYYAGAAAIRSLREAYKKKMGEKYTLKDFHEKFLGFGSSPVKYIRERMLQ
jgi:hypothetical protein